MASRTLEVKITGDPNHLAGAFRKAGAESQTFGSRLRGGAASGLGALAKAGGLAALGVGVGLGAALKHGVSEFAVHQKATAQTNAALKSTGNVAHTSAASIASLADAIEKKSGMDDVAIQSGASLLLTFTNVRNEAGKGNDVFNQATQTIADMSTALGQDTKSSAMQLGKALNDPIKGITALQRVGVSFTKSQKDQVKAMVASGDTMGAQKLILGELNKEFGGSAVAAGQTLPGQLNILKARLSEVAQGIAEKLIPVLTQVVSWVSEHWPQISAVVTTVMNAVVGFIGGAVGFIRAHWDQILAVTARVIAWYRANVAPTIAAVSTAVKAVLAGLQAFWAQWGNQIMSIVRTALNLIKNVIQTVLAVIRGDWSTAWNGIKAIVTGALSLIGQVLLLAVSTFGALASKIGHAVVDKIKDGLSALGSAVKEKLGAVKDALAATPGAVGGLALSIGGRIVDGILSGVGGLYGRLKAKLESDLKGVLSSLNPFSPVEHGGAMFIGRPLIEGAVKGIGDARGLLSGALDTHVRATVTGLTVPTIGSGGGGDIIFNQTPANADPQAIAAAIAWRRRTVSTA